MNAYFVHYPRDFGNEYDVYAVAPALVKAFLSVVPGADRVTRREAVRLGWIRPKEAKRDGEQWFGGFYEDCAGRYPETLAERLADCRRATEALVDALTPLAEDAAREMAEYEAAK